MTILTVLMLSVDQWLLLGSTPGRFGVLLKHWDEVFCDSKPPGFDPSPTTGLKIGLRYVQWSLQKTFHCPV